MIYSRKGFEYPFCTNVLSFTLHKTEKVRERKTDREEVVVTEESMGDGAEGEWSGDCRKCE